MPTPPYLRNARYQPEPPPPEPRWRRLDRAFFLSPWPVIVAVAVAVWALGVGILW